MSIARMASLVHDMDGMRTKLPRNNIGIDELVRTDWFELV